MKRLLYSMAAASVAAGVALASSSPVGASDKPTSDPALSAVESKPATKGRIKTSHFFD
jgi:hypothetical protein